MPEEAEEKSEQREEGEAEDRQQEPEEKVNDPLTRRAARAPRVGWETGQ